MRRLLCAVLPIAMLVACPASEPRAVRSVGPTVAQSPDESLSGHHLLVTIEYSPSGLTVVDSREVALPLRKRNDSGPWRAVLEDDLGRVHHEVSFAAPTLVRGEFAEGKPDDHGENSIEGTHLLRETGAFAVRLPIVPGVTRLRVLAEPWSLPVEDSRADRTPGAARVEVGVIQLPQGAPQ